MSDKELPTKIDLRVRYTQDILKSSLVSLLAQKPLEKIKVTELCAAAGVNRSTFYTHYLDLFDFIDQIKEELKAEILKHMRDHFSPVAGMQQESTIKFLNYLKDNAQLYLHLYQENGPHCLREQMWQLTKDLHLKPATHPDAYAEFQLRFKTFGITSVINDWCGNKNSVQTEELADFLMKCAHITL